MAAAQIADPAKAAEIVKVKLPYGSRYWEVGDVGRLYLTPGYQVQFVPAAPGPSASLLVGGRRAGRVDAPEDIVGAMIAVASKNHNMMHTPNFDKLKLDTKSLTLIGRAIFPKKTSTFNRVVIVDPHVGPAIIDIVTRLFEEENVSRLGDSDKIPTSYEVGRCMTSMIQTLAFSSSIRGWGATSKFVLAMGQVLDISTSITGKRRRRARMDAEDGTMPLTVAKHTNMATTIAMDMTYAGVVTSKQQESDRKFWTYDLYSEKSVLVTQPYRIVSKFVKTDEEKSKDDGPMGIAHKVAGCELVNVLFKLALAAHLPI